MVSPAAFHARVRGSVPGLGGLKEAKNVSSPSTCESQYCGEPSWPRGSVLGLRPPGLEFRILCLDIFPHKARFSRGRRPRPCWISVKTIYWSGDFQERFFLFDPSLTSGMSAALMQGHCIRRRPCIKQHMSGGPEFSQEVSQTAPTTSHQTRDVTCGRVGLMLSQCRRQWANIGLAFGWKINEYSISKSSSLPQ